MTELKYDTDAVTSVSLLYFNCLLIFSYTLRSLKTGTLSQFISPISCTEVNFRLS